MNEKVTVKLSSAGTGEILGVYPTGQTSRPVSWSEANVQVFAGLSSLATHHSDGPATTLTEWVVNLDPQFSWPDLSEVEIVTTYYRQREAEQRVLSVETEGSKRLTQFGRDHARFSLRQFPRVTIRFGEVGEEYSSKELRPGFISYHAKFGELPNRQFRHLVRHALSFATGIELGHLGYTSYNAKHEVVERQAQSLVLLGGWECLSGTHALPPSRLKNTDSIHHCYVDSSLFTRQVEGFLCTSSQYDWPHILALYWQAAFASPLIAAALYGATLEAIRTEWEREHSTPSQPLVTKPVWRKVRQAIGQELERLVNEQQLGKDEADSLKKRIQSLNHLAQPDRWATFFEAIGLTVGSVENQAMKERNRPAHGVAYTPNEFTDVLRKVRSLRVLCSRAILSLSSGADQYTDYCTVGFPERSLADPVPDDS